MRDHSAPAAPKRPRSALEQRRPCERQQQHRDVAIDVRQVVDEIERAVVGPVHVVELDDDRSSTFSADATKHLRGGVEAAAADLACIVADAADMAAVAVVQADQLAQQVRISLRVVVGKQRYDPLFELSLSDIRAVAIANVPARRNQVVQ